MSYDRIKKLQQQSKNRHMSLTQFEKKVLTIKAIAARINRALGVTEYKW